MTISIPEAFAAAAKMIMATAPEEDLIASTPILRALRTAGIGPSRELVAALHKTAEFIEVGLDLAGV